MASISLASSSFSHQERVSTSLLETLYNGVFIRYQESGKPIKYVQVDRITDTFITVQSAVKRSTGAPRFVQLERSSPLLSSDFWPGDEVLAYIPEKRAHFVATIVSIEKGEINLNLKTNDGDSIPWYIEQSNGALSNNLEKVIPLTGRVEDLLKDVPRREKTFEVYDDEEQTAIGYKLIGG